MTVRMNGTPLKPFAPIMVKEGEDGVAIPLPPPAELHGTRLPGGDLHAQATEHTAGFMGAEHLRRLISLENAIAELRDELAPKDHTHPKPPLEPHSHKELSDRLDALEGSFRALNRHLTDELDRRPMIDTSRFALADHVHKPQPIPRHEHPHEHDLVGTEPGLMSPSHLKALQDLQALVKEQAQTIERLSQGQRHIRTLLDDQPEKPMPKYEHGRLPGGGLHACVSERQAGFVSPQLYGRIQKMWDAYVLKNDPESP